MCKEDGEIQEIYRSSQGLCRLHLEKALKKATASQMDILIDVALRKTDELLRDLEGYLKKLDYMVDIEHSDGERNAWGRAMKMYNGFLK